MIASILFLLWFFVSLALFVYSYGFLDFNLTLSSNPHFLSFVGPLQHLVFFARHDSANIYIVIMLLLFLSYIVTLIFWSFKKLPRFPWKFFLCLVLLLTLAYPMLSYDIYNYMFHAKILWFYHANPHLHIPLEYTGDLWLRFMRWVNTTSAYGPVFTLIESPAYLLGFGKFVPVLVLMKIAMSAFFVWCIYLIGKIGETLKFSRASVVRSQLLIALNPFLLMDCVVNGHNDSVMIALFLLAFLRLVQKRTKLSLLMFMLSIGVKYVTALTLPIYLFGKPKTKMLLATVLLFLPMALSPARFQPWYLTWALIPATLLDYAWARVWIVLASVAGLCYYVPYIYSGFWNNSLWFNSLTIYLPVVLTLSYCLHSRRHPKKLVRYNGFHEALAETQTA